MSAAHPMIDHVINATVAAFHEWQKATSDMTPPATPQRLTTTDPENLFNESRPYYFFKKAAILLCREKTDAPFDDILETFNIDDAEYERTKRSFQSWEDTGNKQAISIMTRIAHKAGLPILSFKEAAPAPVIVQPVKRYTYDWEKSDPALATPALSPPFTESAAEQQPEEDAEPAPRGMNDHTRITFLNIKKAVISAFKARTNQNITLDDLDSPARSWSTAACRQFGMYVAYTCMPKLNGSLPMIGDHFGGRDHTTALYACRKIAKKVTGKEPIALAIAEHVSKTLDLSEGQRHALLAGEKISAKRWVELPEETSQPACRRSPVSP